MEKYIAFTEAINMLIEAHFWKLMALSMPLWLWAIGRAASGIARLVRALRS